MRKYKLVELGNGTVAIGFGKKYMLDYVYPESEREKCLANVLVWNVGEVQEIMDKLVKEFDDKNYGEVLNCDFTDLLC